MIFASSRLSADLLHALRGFGVEYTGDMAASHNVLSGDTSVYWGSLQQCRAYLQNRNPAAMFGLRIVSIEAAEALGRADFLRGECDKPEWQLRRQLRFSAPEIRAYVRGFNAEAAMHGFDD